MASKGPMEPVVITGKKLVDSWWGKAWNRNLESYADMRNRISRGRSYLKAGAVIDLKISEGQVNALVSGSRVKPYKVTVEVDTISPDAARDIQSRCSEKLSDAEALYEGRMPPKMEDVLTSRGGLFPTESQIHFHCSCPDYANMCKHVAAVLYGIGVRFDSDPRLFFELRGVPMDMLVETTMRNRLDLMLQNADRVTSRMLDDSLVESLFGVVENREHERADSMRETLIGMMGRPMYEEGSVLVREGSVSEPQDIGDDMVKTVVSERGGNRYRVIIWKDRFGNPQKSECDCDSDGMCRHISASLITGFSPKDDIQREAELEREFKRLSEIVERLPYEIDDIYEDEDDDFWDDDYVDPDELDEQATEAVTKVLDDVFDTMGDDPRVIQLYDDIYYSCSEVCDGVHDALTSRLADMNSMVTSMDSDTLVDLLQFDSPSWVFHFVSDIPRDVLLAAFVTFRDDLDWNVNQRELAYQLGEYGQYISHTDEIRRVDAILRCAGSAIALHREDDAVHYAEMLRDDEDIPDRLSGNVDDLLRKLKLEDKRTAILRNEFMQHPSEKSLRAVMNVCRCDRSELVAKAFKERSDGKDLDPDELAFFIDNGMIDDVVRYLDADVIDGLLQGYPYYDKLMWLFATLDFNERYESAALLARSIVRRILDRDRWHYDLAAKLLRAMDSKSGYEHLEMQPHSEYMRSLRETDGKKRNLWKLYEGM